MKAPRCDDCGSGCLRFVAFMSDAERYTSKAHAATYLLSHAWNTICDHEWMMSIEITFPGGVVVQATHGSHTVCTDQPAPAGGTDSAMSPFDLFLSSIATCMGYYAVKFCRERSLGTEGLGLTLTPVRDPQAGRLAKLQIELRLPREFPEKYRQAILRAVDHCAVKRAILEPPEFAIEVLDGAAISSRG